MYKLPSGLDVEVLSGLVRRYVTQGTCWHDAGTDVGVHVGILVTKTPSSAGEGKIHVSSVLG